MHTATYTVTGMTCGHCVNAVSGELRKLPGVTKVDIDLDSGPVAVDSDAPLEPDAVRSAVHDSGYALGD